MGELIPRKNHEVVIKALGEMKNSGIRYMIAGKGELETELKFLVHSLELDDQVMFLGFRTDISELCQAADLFVFPSHQEGLSLALMEAIACETPVVCSDIRGNTDLVKDRDYIFDENRVDDVVRTLKNLTNNSRDCLKKTSADSVKKNKQALKKYSLSAVEKQMKTVYGLVSD